MNKKYLSLILLLSILIMYPYSLFAQEIEGGTVEVEFISFEDLMKMGVTTASKKEQSLAEAAATMIVITSQMIKDRGYHHLEEILHDLPGFDFNKNYGVNYSTIFMRGYRSENSDRFILLFDGINENDIWKQTTWISRQYPVSQIKQIEVLYGPASALYGTNAFSGIINVITKEGDDVGVFNLTTGYGSWGRKNIEISSGKKIGDKFSYNVTGKYFQQDDIHQWDYFDVIDGSTKNFSQSYINAFNGTPKLAFMVDEKYVEQNFNEDLPGDDWAIHGNLRYGDFKFTVLTWQKNELESYFYNPFKRSGKWTEWFEGFTSFNLSHNFELNDKLSFSTNINTRSHNILDSQEGGFKYYTAPLTDTNDPDYLHSQTIVHSDPSTYQLTPVLVSLADGTTKYVTGKVYNYELSTSDFSIEEQITFDMNEKLNLIGGIKYTITDTQEDYNYGTTWDKVAKTPRHDKKTIAAYAQAIYKPVEKLSLTLGGRFEDQKDENDDGYNVFTPRFSVVYKATNDLIFRFQYAEAFQEADDWHKFATDSDVRPHNSADLEPEKLKSFELGTTIIAGENLMLSGAGYYTEVSNFITEVQNTPANPYNGYDYGIHYENTSGGEVKIYGYELSFNAQLQKGLLLEGNLSGTFNYNVDDEEIGDMAPLKFNLGLLYNYQNKITFYPKLNFVGKKKTINWKEDPTTKPIFTEIDNYAIVGINVNILNMFGTIEGLDFNIKIDNLFDSEYYNPGSRSANGTKYTARVLQPGFNVLAGFTYNFSN